MDLKDLDFEQLHMELAKHVGCDLDRTFRPVRTYSDSDYLELVVWRRDSSFQSTEKGRNIIKGVIKVLINDIKYGRVRSNFKLEDIAINSYDEVAILVCARPLTLHELVDEQAKSEIYQGPLNCLTALIVRMCNWGAYRVPKDLAHLVLYLKDFKTFWNAHRFLLNHPSCWSNLKFFNIMLSMRSLVRNSRKNDVSYGLKNAVGRAYPEGFAWKDVILSRFIDTDNYPESDFKHAAYITFYYESIKKPGTFKDDGVGFLTYIQNLLEQRKKDSSNLGMEDDLENSYTVEVVEMVNMLFPLFLPKIINVIYGGK